MPRGRPKKKPQSFREQMKDTFSSVSQAAVEELPPEPTAKDLGVDPKYSPYERDQADRPHEHVVMPGETIRPPTIEEEVLAKPIDIRMATHRRTCEEQATHLFEGLASVRENERQFNKLAHKTRSLAGMALSVLAWALGKKIPYNPKGDVAKYFGIDLSKIGNSTEDKIRAALERAREVRDSEAYRSKLSVQQKFSVDATIITAMDVLNMKIKNPINERSIPVSLEAALAVDLRKAG